MGGGVDGTSFVRSRWEGRLINANVYLCGNFAGSILGGSGVNNVGKSQSPALEEETYQIPKWLRLQSVPGATFSCFLRAIHTRRWRVVSLGSRKEQHTEYEDN